MSILVTSIPSEYQIIDHLIMSGYCLKSLYSSIRHTGKVIKLQKSLLSTLMRHETGLVKSPAHMSHKRYSDTGKVFGLNIDT